MEKRKNNRTKEQGAETKKQIYACAEKLFRADDYQNVSVEAITNMAGVTKGTFYVHFESKDALLLELMMAYVKRMDMQYNSFFEGLPDEMASADVILTVVDKIIELMTDQLGCQNMRAVYRMQLSSTVKMEVVKGYGRKMYKIFQEILERGVQRQEFITKLSPEVLARHFVMAIRGLTYEWCIRYPDFDFKQEASMHIGLLLDGIRVDKIYNLVIK
ncbi:MAG: TetR/AcrR family transcriptional regulator [Eubacteriales bacterium]|nr:TetR/AcrR family transcriptional regulator [Eubacteriales bacterium]MDD4390264.1 TetR/AcrR family transcriptional regulator [Eubacteriales bacterium]